MRCDIRSSWFVHPAIVACLIAGGAAGCGGGTSRPSGTGGASVGTGGASSGSGGSGTGGTVSGGSGAGGAATGGTAGTGGTIASTGGRGGATAGTGGASASTGGRGGATAGTGGTNGGGAGGDSVPPGVTYSGCAFVGGINRLVIAKQDATRNLCVVLVLDSPGANPFNLTLPPNWGMEFAFAAPATTGCLVRFPGANAVAATAGAGTVTLPPAGTSSLTPTVDVTLTFPPGDAGAASTERLMATDLPAPFGCP